MNTSKIIKAYIGAGTYSTTEPITQGDYGYILQIEGTELPATYRVDFSNNRHEGEALTVYGNENGAEVPEELIATGKDIFAFYYYIGENFGKTAYTWKIPNDTRAKYGDRTPTPTQQDSIDQLIVRSNEAVETAEEKAEEADTSARSAKEDADRAEQARDDAQTAQGKAEDAQESAERAKDDAVAANTSAQQSESAMREILEEYSDVATEATAQEILQREEDGLALMEFALRALDNRLDTMVEDLPHDTTGQQLASALNFGNSMLNALYNELANEEV